MSDRPIDPHEVGFGFLMVEVGTGLTFARVATDAGDDVEKRDRNRANAQTAHDTILKFRKRVTLTTEQSLALDAGLDQLFLAIAAIPK